MKLKGETFIAAPRETVWAALCDPKVLAACIDGVETLEATGENSFSGTMNAKIGPVRAKFKGAVTLQNLDPPNSYLIVGEGKGGVAGFAKGSANIQLSSHETAPGDRGTRLAYSVTSSVGGKLAQLGARLVEGAAKGYADAFFVKFKALVETDGAGADAGPTATDMVAAGGAQRTSDSIVAGLPVYLWAALVAIAVAALLAALWM